MRNTSYRYWMIYVIAIVAAMGGLLFGFDTGVISGAIPFFQKDFGIDDSMVEVVTSSGLLGAILGALCCGKLTDRIGRRKVILTSAVIFAIGALWSGWAPGIYHLIAARLFLGVAIGISSFAVPLYIAEVSPAKSRGMFVAMFQLMITIGLLVSYLSDLYFADETSVSCWRPMFYVGVIPAIILFVGMLLVPPSPRWLMSVGREEESLSVLKMIEHPDQVNVSFEQMRNEMRKNDEQQGRFKDLAQPCKRAGGFSRFIVRLVFQCDRIVYLFQDTEGILNTGNRFNDQWRKPRESGRSVLILCVYWNCGDYLGIFLCTGNERSFIGEYRGFLEKRRTPER